MTVRTQSVSRGRKIQHRDPQSSTENFLNYLLCGSPLILRDSAPNRTRQAISIQPARLRASLCSTGSEISEAFVSGAESQRENGGAENSSQFPIAIVKHMSLLPLQIAQAARRYISHLTGHGKKTTKSRRHKELQLGVPRFSGHLDKHGVTLFEFDGTQVTQR